MPVKGRIFPSVVVAVDKLCNPCPALLHRLVALQVDVLILDGLPEPFDADIVIARPFESMNCSCHVSETTDQASGGPDGCSSFPSASSCGHVPPSLSDGSSGPA